MKKQTQHYFNVQESIYSNLEIKITDKFILSYIKSILDSTQNFYMSDKRIAKNLGSTIKIIRASIDRLTKFNWFNITTNYNINETGRTRKIEIDNDLLIIFLSNEPSPDFIKKREAKTEKGKAIFNESEAKIKEAKNLKKKSKVITQKVKETPVEVSIPTKEDLVEVEPETIPTEVDMIIKLANGQEVTILSEEKKYWDMLTIRAKRDLKSKHSQYAFDIKFEIEIENLKVS